MIGFGFSNMLWLSLLLMLVTGFGMMQGMTASNTIIQTLVPEDKRGRVMSYYTSPLSAWLHSEACSPAHWATPSDRSAQ